MWPIRDMTGNTVGFGGRRLYEDDKGPKYLNSPETPVYKKSQVLYGIEHAKRNIAKQRQLVVVEATPTSWPAMWPAWRRRWPPAALPSARAM